MDRISEAVATTRAGRAWACRNRYTGSWSTRFPAINGSGLHMIRQGSPWLVTENAPAMRLRAGDLVFVPHGPAHGFSWTPMPFRDLSTDSQRNPHLPSFDVEFVSCCYHLDRGREPEFLNGLPDVVTMTVDDKHPTLGILVDLLDEHAVDDRPGSGMALPAVVDLLLVHLLRAWPDQQDGEVRPETDDPHFNRALLAVQDNPQKPWTVQQLSELAQMSRASFSRRFADVMGETPRAYLVRRRLDQGAALLRHTELPLAAIAGQLGYSTEFSFAAAFRRELGIAPGRFRRRERDDQA